MSATPISYRKLPIRALSLITNAPLWIADDHLLEVKSTVLHEHYRRFFFKDITSFIILPTKGYRLRNLIYGSITAAILLLFCLFATTSSPIIFGTFKQNSLVAFLITILSPFFILFLTLFIINLFLGPTCHCYLFFNSSPSIRLIAPTRIRAARRVLNKLIPLLQPPTPPQPDSVPLP